MIGRFEASPDIAFRTYGLTLTHKHLHEMKEYAGLHSAPVFSPSVVPAHRGMIVDVPIPAAQIPGVASSFLFEDALVEAYASSPVVQVCTSDTGPSELLLSKKAEAWDGMELFVACDENGDQARLIARLDNLGKGASGAAIQNLNIMCGLPEATGLRL